MKKDKDSLEERFEYLVNITLPALVNRINALESTLFRDPEDVGVRNPKIYSAYRCTICGESHETGIACPRMQVR